MDGTVPRWMYNVCLRAVVRKGPFWNKNAERFRLRLAFTDCLRA